MKRLDLLRRLVQRVDHVRIHAVVGAGDLLLCHLQRGKLDAVKLMRQLTDALVAVSLHGLDNAPNGLLRRNPLTKRALKERES